jgi:hypothetical protein
MRDDGTWGDEPEIQAATELYRRPLEIYTAADERSEFQVSRREPAHTSDRPPIRLRYIGGLHYDSVVGPDWQDGLLDMPAGVYETAAVQDALLEKYNNREE